MLGLLAQTGLSLTARSQVTVVSRQPARHAVAAARNSSVTVGFSQPISAASAGNLRVYSPLLRGKRPGTVAGGGTSVLSFTPNQAFAPGEVLSVSLPATMASTSGTAVSRQVYQFTAATGGSGRGFFADTTVVGYTGNRDQVLGDLDNDGDLDLVTTGGLFGCRVYLNDGTGRYIFKNGVIIGQQARGTALADVDQDGDLDLLVADAMNAWVTVCLNDGTGEFIGSVTGAQNVPVGTQPVSVAAGDVDGDGDLDFATANGTSNSATICFNNGALPMLYNSASTVAMGAGPTAVALADLDNDGDLDLLTSNAGTASAPLGVVNVSRNTGAGVFGAYTSVAVGLQPTELVLADIDNDGDQDLLTANTGGASLSIRINNGGGSFSGGTTLALPAGSTLSGLRAGDMDADGDLDLMVAQGTGGRVYTFLNTSGTFALQARALRLSRDTAHPASSTGIVLGDVDGDGDLDVITSNSSQVVLSLNVGSLPSLPSPVISSLSPGSGPVGATVIIAGSGLTDITGVFFNGLLAPGFVPNASGTAIIATVPAGASSGVVTVTTEEAGTATSPTPFTITVPVPVLITNFTPARNAVVPRNTTVSATFAAAITAATADNVRVFSNLRRGRQVGTLAGAGTTALTFDPAQDFAPGERVSVSLPGSLQAADGNQVAAQVLQFTAAAGGTGQVNYDVATTLAITRPGEPVLGDVDNDGDLDLLTPDSYSGTVTMQLNNGAGGFGSTPGIATGLLGVRSVALGDVDGDGDLDLLVDPAYDPVGIWLNNGSGAFTSAGTVPNTASIQQMLLGDVDADGDLDLVLRTSQQVLVRRNNGAGVFSGNYDFTVFYSLGGAAPNHMALGDVDADGDLDLVVGGASSQYAQHPVRVELNDGTGQYTGAQEILYRDAPSRILLGDLDNDGDLDLGVQSTSNYVLRTNIRLNNGTGTFTGTNELLLNGVGATLADADADGDFDVISPYGIGINNGAGGFGAIVSFPTYTYFPAGVALGDLDGDLDLDLVTSQENDVTVRLNRPFPAPTITALTPSSGPVGSSVVLTGTNLIGARTVAFNGVPAASFTVNSRSELVATVPPGASTGPITVTTPAGTATSAPFTVTVVIPVLSVSPARNAINAPRTGAVVATFAQPISSATAANMRVHGSQLRGRRTGTVTGGGSSTLTFTPTLPFAAGETVTVTLPATLAGTSNGNVQRHVHQFTAAATGTGTGNFMATGAPDIPNSSNVNDIMAVDLDTDGDLDLITSSGSIRLNNGNGTFGPLVTLGPNVYFNSLYSMALADVDSNGTLDILASGGEVFLNNGAASFTAMPNFAPFTYNMRDVATGDFDGDGDADVVYPLENTDSLFVRFNNGSGGFTALQRVAVGPRPNGVAVGDVDNDGDLDVVAACMGTGSGYTSVISICLNNGNGVFTRSSQISGNSGSPNGYYYATRVVLGDVDGDSDLDLITNSGLLRLNNGSGVFSGTQTTPEGDALALGDVDSDGDLDLVVTANSATPFLRLNNGQGQFTASPTPLSFGGITSGGLALADLDNDGDLDAVASGSFTDLMYVRLNQRVAPPTALTFTPASGLPGDPVVINGIDLIGTTSVRFNGTAATNFVVNSASQITVSVPAGATSGPVSVTNPAGTATSTASFTVLLPVTVASTSPARNATATLTAPVTVNFSRALPLNSPAVLAAHSLQRGGRLAGTRTGAGTSTLSLVPAQPFVPGEEVSVSIPAYTDANQARVVKQVYRFRAAASGTGRGFMAAPTSIPLPATALAAVLGDVNGDGSQDAVLHTGAAVEIKLNNGAAGFSAGSSVAVTQSTQPTLALGDVDGDGDLDLAAASYSNNVVNIRLNNGAGVFSGTLSLPVAERPRSIALADMDADGDLDVVTANQGASSCTISVRFNNGTGSFSGTTDQFMSTGTNVSFSNMEIGDVDGDGDLDVVVANDTGHVLANDGNGNLSAAPGFTFTYSTASIALRDIDGDNDLDVLALGFPSIGGQASRVRVCRNNGLGTFIASEFDVANNTAQMVVGDVDADGDADIIVVNESVNRSELWSNNGQGYYALQMDLSLGAVQRLALLGDLDNDGDLDILNAYRSALLMGVCLNGPTPPPVITSFTPTSGFESTRVVITGSGFWGTTAVRFNGANALGFVVNSPTQITVLAPVGVSTGPISVVTPVATAASAAAFTVVPLVSATTLAPGRNATGVARNAPVVLTFGAPVMAATAGNLRVFGNQLRGRRPGLLTGGGTATLSFDPTQDFGPGEQISVSVPATMQTTTGGVMRRQVYQFTAATGGPGRGAFRAGIDVAVARFATSMTVGDLDNDGDLDLLSSTESSSVGYIGVMLNHGNATFSAGATISPGAYSSIEQIVLGDVDSDGDLDVLASYGASVVSVCLNNGNATFAQPLNLYINCGRFALGDVDADGDLDLVASAYQSGRVTVALNDGTGVFAAQTATAVASPTVRSIMLGDVDGDGDLDLATGNDASGVRLYLNDGAGVFTAGAALTVPGTTQSALLGDLDRDGDLDLAVAYNDAAGYGWLTTCTNDGIGTLTLASQRVATARYINHAQIGDVDADGDLDFVAVSSSGATGEVSVRINTGQGLFASTPSLSVHSYPTLLALGDLDGDGDLDVAATQTTNGSTFIDLRLNDGLALAAAPQGAGAAQVHLFPNPAHEQFTIVVPVELRPAAGTLAQVQLYNTIGQQVLEQRMALDATGSMQVNVAHLPAGIYTLHLPLGGQVTTLKLVVY